MSDIALFHSVLGVRPGVDDAAERLTEAGHRVKVVDQYDGRIFDDYDEASAFAEAIGYPALMQMAADSVSDLPSEFIAMGFSNGGGMAEFVATCAPVSRVVMLSGALPMSVLETSGWPAGIPGQIHYTLEDPFRNQAWIDELTSDIEAANGTVEVFDYPGSGHLFTDASLPAEYDPRSAAKLWERVLAFCGQE